MGVVALTDRGGMPRPEDEQRIIDAEVARAAELLRQEDERSRKHAESHRQEEEHRRSEQEHQRLHSEVGREDAEQRRQRQGTSDVAERLDLRRRVAALEQTVAELVRAQQGRAPGRSSHASSDHPSVGTEVPAD